MYKTFQLFSWYRGGDAPNWGWGGGWWGKEGEEEASSVRAGELQKCEAPKIDGSQIRQKISPFQDEEDEEMIRGSQGKKSSALSDQASFKIKAAFKTKDQTITFKFSEEETLASSWGWRKSRWGWGWRAEEGHCHVPWGALVIKKPVNGEELLQ